MHSTCVTAGGDQSLEKHSGEGRAFLSPDFGAFEEEQINCFILNQAGCSGTEAYTRTCFSLGLDNI